MEENLKKCAKCETLNEPEYVYCKNCGEPLAIQEPILKEEQPSAAFHSGAENTAQSLNEDRIARENEGIDVNDLYVFVGNGNQNIVPKWIDMSIAKKKTSWSWPVFLLTFFLGIFGTSLWFLYRKMYKIGALLLALSAILTIAGSVLLYQNIGSFFPEDTQTMEQILEGDIEAILSGKTNEEELLRLSFGIFAVAGVIRLFQIAASVIFALFAYEGYRRFAISRIKSFHRPLSVAEISGIGGTSGGGIAVGIAARFVTFFLCYLIFVAMMVVGIFQAL